MTGTETIRAWKDPHYRGQLDAAVLASLPAHPAGVVALKDADLSDAGLYPPLTTADTCTMYTFRGWSYCCP